MRIAIVAHLKHPIAEPFAGGLEMHTHFLAARLRARGHDVVLFAAEGSDDAVVICPPTILLDHDPRTAATVDDVEYDANIDVIDRLKRGGFDLVHFNALHFLPIERAPALGAPMIAVLHTPPFDRFAVALRHAGDDVTIVSVSHSLSRDWDLPQRPIVIDNGVDLTRFRFVESPTRPAFALWSGRIVPEKGLHLAIDAARRAGLPLRIAGKRIDAGYWDREIAHRLAEDARYLGHLSQAELAEETGRASVLVCTPRWPEPFGLVIVEAFACGTPVAGFARGALPDIVDERCGVLAPSDDVEGLATAMRSCLGLDRRDCRRMAETRFDAEAMIDAYEELYRHALERAAEAVA